MNTRFNTLTLLTEDELTHVSGGGGRPKDFGQETKNLAGAALGGGMAGAAYGAPGGPGAIASGALGGAAVGVGAYMVNAYCTGGDRSKIPSLNQNTTYPWRPQGMQVCHQSYPWRPQGLHSAHRPHDISRIYMP